MNETAGTDQRGHWRRTWWLDLKRGRVRFRYHVQVRGVSVRMPWIAWAMFS